MCFALDPTSPGEKPPQVHSIAIISEVRSKICFAVALMHYLLHPSRNIRYRSPAVDPERMIDGIKFIGQSPPIRGLPWAGTEPAVAHCEHEGATVVQDQGTSSGG